MEENEPPAVNLQTKVTIRREDYRQIRKVYREMRPELKAQITDAIKARDIDKHGIRVAEIVSISAIFAKFSTQARDRKFIKDTFSLDDTDLAFLIRDLTPAGGEEDITGTMEFDGNQQPELFPKTDEEKRQTRRPINP